MLPMSNIHLNVYNASSEYSVKGVFILLPSISRSPEFGIYLLSYCNLHCIEPSGN